MSLAFYYALLAKKQSDLLRLEKCEGNLQMKQGEFTENQNLMTKPSLTTTTWHGNWAQAFDDIREDGILASYIEIETTQFNAAFEALTAKIKETKEEIERIQLIIAQLLAAQRVLP
jgi:hypothetical protein